MKLLLGAREGLMSAVGNSPVQKNDDLNDEHRKLNIVEQSDDLNDLLGKLRSEEHPRTIYKVHSELRNMNNKAYEPNLIAIGPYHSHNFKSMQAHKLFYLQNFLHRGPSVSVEDCFSAIEKREVEARNCYAEPIKLSPTQFTNMLVLDGCFIIEYVLQHKESGVLQHEESESHGFQKGNLSYMPWMQKNIARDLMLFENQIPYFVISELYTLIGGEDKNGDLMRLILNFLKVIYPHQGYEPRPQNLAPIKHLLGLIHRSFIQLEFDESIGQLFSRFGVRQKYKGQGRQKDKGQGRQNYISCATKLAKSSVKFEPSTDSSMFRISFDSEKGCMRLPYLDITDTTESFFRNLIAYEQYVEQGEKCYVTDFAILLGNLINSAEDIKLLMKCRVLENWSGSEEAIAEMFNRLTDHVFVAGHRFIYESHVKRVVKYCTLPETTCKVTVKKWMDTLKQSHLSSPWAIISLLGATVLLVLTFLQTLYTIRK